MNKPKFDPSKPFSVVGGKPKFDSSKPFEVVEMPGSPSLDLSAPVAGESQDQMLNRMQLGFKQNENANVGQAFIQGLGKEATLGYLPEIQAGVQRMLPNPTAEADAKLKALGIEASDENLTEQFRNRQGLLQKENPVAFGAGQITGAVTGGAATGSIAGKIAGQLRNVPALMNFMPNAGTLASSIGEAAATGAAYNPEETEGDRLDNAITGARNAGVIGLGTKAFGAALGSTSKGIKDLPEKADLAGTNASVYAIGANKNTIKPLLDPRKGGSIENLKKLGEFIKDKKILSVGDSIDDIAEKTDLLQERIGQQLGELHDITNAEAGKLKVNTIISEAREKLMGAAEGISGSSAVKRAIKNELKDLETIATKNADPGLEAFQAVGLSKEAPSASLQKLMNYRTSLWRQIYKGDSLKQFGLAVDGNKLEAQIRVRDFLTKKIDEIVDSSSGANAKLLKKLNNEYRLASQANQIAQDRFAAETGNNFYSLRDNMAGVGGLAAGLANDSKSLLGATAQGLGLAAASKAMRTYGRPVYQGGVEGLGKAAASVPENATAIGRAAGGLIKQQAGPIGLLGSRLNMSQEKKRKQSE